MQSWRRTTQCLSMISHLSEQPGLTSSRSTWLHREISSWGSFRAEADQMVTIEKYDSDGLESRTRHVSHYHGLGRELILGYQRRMLLTWLFDQDHYCRSVECNICRNRTGRILSEEHLCSILSMTLRQLSTKTPVPHNQEPFDFPFTRKPNLVPLNTDF